VPSKLRQPLRNWLLLGSLLLTACTGTLSPPAPPALQDKIAAILAAYGGREALAGVTSIAAHGRIDDFLRQSTGGYARTMRRPGGLRIDIMPEAGGEVRILDGEHGWQGSGTVLRAANPFALTSMRYQYGYLDLPMSLADGSARVSDGGRRELHGQPFDVLLIDLRDAPQLRAYFDPTTHLLRRVEADFSMGGMGSSQLGTEYEDFRAVGGLLFPHRLNNFAGGGRISVITIDRLTLNQPLPAGVFAPN
jgi:hypothetical protein